MGSTENDVERKARRLPFPQLIAKKRDGETLSPEEIQQFVDGVTQKDIQECQIGE